MFPHLTIQAYVTVCEPRTLIAVGVVRTQDLILFVHDGKVGDDYEIDTNKSDGNQFAVVSWEKLISAGIKCLIITP